MYIFNLDYPISRYRVSKLECEKRFSSVTALFFKILCWNFRHFYCVIQSYFFNYYGWKNQSASRGMASLLLQFFSSYVYCKPLLFFFGEKVYFSNFFLRSSSIKFDFDPGFLLIKFFILFGNKLCPRTIFLNGT